MLVVFEGIDGAGKATQIRKLVAHLRLKGRKCEVRAYPDMNGPLGRVIDDVLHERLQLGAEAQFYVFLADIVRDQKRLRDALESNDVVILDRYCLSTVAYQKCKGMAEKRELEFVKSARPIPPDLILLLDLDARSATARKEAQRALDAFEANPAFQENVRKAFKSLARRKFLCRRWRVVDASRAPEEVFGKVQAEIDKLIK
jgi:dTMP kinase